MAELLDTLSLGNTNLLYEVRKLGQLIDTVKNKVSQESVRYFDYCRQECELIEAGVKRNLSRIRLGRVEIAPDVLSDTQRLTLEFQALSELKVPPLFQSRQNNRLCWMIIDWLHQSHEEARCIISTVSDGSFSILPSPPIAIYYLPISAQRGYLLLPLLFHEFGHVLYRIHAPELDTLVQEAQTEIRQQIEPAVGRGDGYDAGKAAMRRKIVETWFHWFEELFCDAVAYQIGGSTYTHAFSAFLLMRGHNEFYLPSSRLSHSTHPVSWIRAQVLTDRMTRDGAKKEAVQFRDTWATIAAAIKIEEDFYGFYDSSLLAIIQRTIGDMLTEADPVQSDNDDRDGCDPRNLLKMAWHQFLLNPDNYDTWEQSMLSKQRSNIQ